MAKVVWTDESLDDLEAIGVYHDRTSPPYARALVRRLFDSVQVLERHPRIGRIVPELANEDVRELLVDGYRIVYRLRGNRIEVSVILHGRQEASRKLGDRGEDV